MFDRDGKKTMLIHDNSGELKWFDYESMRITGVAITPYSPKTGQKQASCSPMHPVYELTEYSAVLVSVVTMFLLSYS